MPSSTRDIGLGLGSNIGDKPANIARALDLLNARGLVRISKISALYRTAPWGNLEQEDFANACALATTAATPLELLAEVKAVESLMGREESVRWGPRLIDIDILFYGDTTLDVASLTLPHKDLFQRAFVLVPLAEIAPDLVLGGKSVAAAAALAVKDQALEFWNS